MMTLFKTQIVRAGNISPVRAPALRWKNDSNRLLMVPRSHPEPGYLSLAQEALERFLQVYSSTFDHPPLYVPVFISTHTRFLCQLSQRCSAAFHIFNAGVSR